MKNEKKAILFVVVAALGINASASWADRKNASPKNKKVAVTKPGAKPNVTKSTAAKLSSSLLRKKSNKEGFVPSVYSGVMVRSVPLTNTHSVPGARPGSIYIKPGGQRPTRAVRPGVRDIPRAGPGRSAKGGRFVTLPDSRMPLISARRDAKGKVVVEENESHGKKAK